MRVCLVCKINMLLCLVAIRNVVESSVYCLIKVSDF